MDGFDLERECLSEPTPVNLWLIRKKPSMVGALVVDRMATSATPGRHFTVKSVLPDHETTTLELEGLTLVGGNIGFIWGMGGSVYIQGWNAHGIFTNCTFTNNKAIVSLKVKYSFYRCISFACIVRCTMLILKTKTEISGIS